MNFIALLFAIEVGIMPVNGYVDGFDYTDQQAVYTDIDFRVLAWDLFFIGGESITYMTNNPGRSFDPFAQSYTFKFGISVNSFEFGFRHKCGPHPIDAYPLEYDVDPYFPYEGAYEQIYIKYEYGGEQINANIRL